MRSRIWRRLVLWYARKRGLALVHVTYADGSTAISVPMKRHLANLAVESLGFHQYVDGHRIIASRVIA